MSNHLLQIFVGIILQLCVLSHKLTLIKINHKMYGKNEVCRKKNQRRELRTHKEGNWQLSHGKIQSES